MTNTVWSFSSLKTFQQCPRKYYHTKVLKDVKEPDTTATLYGKEMHTAAEEYIRDGVVLPNQFSYLQKTLDALNAIEGEKHCEVKLGLTKNLESCEFDAPNVWWHGIADLVVINQEKQIAHSIDYKTSKNARYADVGQLDLIACGLFAKFPTIQRVKSALLFVVSKDFVKAQHHREMMLKYMEKPSRDVIRIEKAKENGIWNPSTSALCRFCSVDTCEHYGGYRR